MLEIYYKRLTCITVLNEEKYTKRRNLRQDLNGYTKVKKKEKKLPKSINRKEINICEMFCFSLSILILLKPVNRKP